MKITRLLSFTLLVFAMISCSGDDGGSETVNPVSEFPMTAKINNVLFEMKNPFGSDYATDSFYSDYPDETYIQLQGRPGYSLGMWEVTLYIKRTDLQVGTIDISREDNWNDTYLRLIDNTIDNYTVTNTGQLHITEVNTTAKTVKGTFDFTTIDVETDEIIHHVTDGKFSYKYDVDY